jgi:hypothetical protein
LYRLFGGIMFKRLLIVLTFVLLAASLGENPAFATFTFTVVPDRGGKHIRFSPAKTDREVRNEEVTLTVSSDEAKQYRVTQQLIHPLTNATGATLSTESLKIFSPTNVGGSLDITFPTELSSSAERIFLSDSQGTAETFQLIFALEVDSNQEAGRYTGQLIYQLEASSGGVAAVTVTLNVSVEVITDLNLLVTNSSGASRLDLGTITKNQVEGEDVLQLQITASTGGSYSIYQEVIEGVRSLEGRTMDDNRVYYQMADADVGEVTSIAAQPLLTTKTLIYQSNDSGSAASFEIAFSTSDMDDQLAGNYKGTLRYTLEAGRTSFDIEPVQIPIEVEVAKLFFIDVDFDLSGGLYFGKLRAAEDQTMRRIVLNPHSNTGDVYQVVQHISRPFTTEAGDELDFANFKGMMTGATKGQMLLTTETVMHAGDIVVYKSDDVGSSDEFMIDYVLSLPRGTKQGDYSSETSFSMTVI